MVTRVRHTLTRNGRQVKIMERWGYSRQRSVILGHLRRGKQWSPLGFERNSYVTVISPFRHFFCWEATLNTFHPLRTPAPWSSLTIVFFTWHHNFLVICSCYDKHYWQVPPWHSFSMWFFPVSNNVYYNKCVERIKVPSLIFSKKRFSWCKDILNNWMITHGETVSPYTQTDEEIDVQGRRVTHAKGQLMINLSENKLSSKSWIRLFPWPYVFAEDDNELSPYYKLGIVLKDWHLLSFRPQSCLTTLVQVLFTL